MGKSVTVIRVPAGVSLPNSGLYTLGNTLVLSDTQYAGLPYWYGSNYITVNGTVADPIIPVTHTDQAEIDAEIASLGSASFERIATLNVKNYGAKGDGTTDDTTAIRAAITAYLASSSISGLLYFPRGSYLTSAQIDLAGCNGLTLYGDGQDVSGFICTTAINAAFIATSAVSGVTFRDLGWTGGVTYPVSVPSRTRTTASSFQHAVQFDGSLVPGETNPVISNVTFTRCRVTNCVSLPVFFRGVGGYTKITDSFFDNTLDVGLIYCTDVLVSRNRALNGADNGFSISRGCRKVVCTDNKVDGTAYYGVWISGFVIDSGGGVPGTGSDTGPQDFVCTGNLITNVGRAGIGLINAPKNGTITGNVVDTVSRGDLNGPTDNYGFGIHVAGYPQTIPGTPTDYADNLNIHSNTLLNCARGGIFLQSAVRYSKIESNLIINPGSQFLADGSTTPSTADNLNNFGISADNISTHTTLDVNNNTVIDSRGTPRANFSVSVSTTITSIRAAGNRGILTHDVVAGGNATESFDTFFAAKTITALLTATAGLRVGSSAGTTNLFSRIDGAAGNAKRFIIGTGASVDRWAWTGNGTSEGGSNAGTDLELRAYSDAGSLIFTPLTFTRSNGLTTFGRAVAFSLATQTLSSNGAVTIDARAGDATITLQANATSSSVINPATNQKLTITWLQDSTGGRTYSWPNTCKFGTGVTTGTTVASGPPTDTTLSKRTSVTFQYDGSNWNEISRSVAVG